MLASQIEAPAWAVAITLAGALAFVAREAIKTLRTRATSTNNTTPRLLVLVEQVEKNMTGQTAALQALTTNIALLTQQIENLPTRVELSEGFERARHDMRNIVAPILGELQLRRNR